MSVGLEQLSDELVHSIMQRVDFDSKRQTLPLVCKAFAKLLRQPAVPGIWGTVVLDLDVLYTKYKGRVRPLRHPDVLHSVAWLGLCCNGIICVRIVQYVPQHEEFRSFDPAEVALLVGQLLGRFTVYSRCPSFALCLQSPDSGGILMSALFHTPTLRDQLCPSIRVLELRFDFETPLEGLAILPQLVSLEELKLEFNTGNDQDCSQHLTNIGQLGKLQVLELAGSDLDALPDGMLALTQLRSLSCLGSRVRQLPSDLPRLAELRVLRIINSSIPEFPDALLAALPQLQHVELTYYGTRPRFISKPMTCLWSLPHLRFIDVSDCDDAESIFHVCQADMLLKLEHLKGERRTIPFICYTHSQRISAESLRYMDMLKNL